MNLQDRIQLLSQLGKQLQSPDEEREEVIQRAYQQNQWFTPENSRISLDAIATHFLEEEKLRQWLSAYPIETVKPLIVGLVLAGNIPLVGFHDILCVFASGHRAMIKLSDKDALLIPYLIRKMTEINPAAGDYFNIVDALKGYDAVIATGSNNTARYFESYFAKVPHIIRQNRNSVAVLDGAETSAELTALGKDVFRYFGLGCRNVSKLYVPEGYDFEPLLEALYLYRDIAMHNKYKNNFDYNYALYILNKIPYHGNACILLTQNTDITSRIASLNYEFYNDLPGVEAELLRRKDELQCIVSKMQFKQLKPVAFGQTQQPELWDYADGVDTMRFLCSLPQ